ncbi:TcpD family membrane protein [Enterococcus sp. HY326]|uniref:TcpD family membrane protein n=1 Tax=Enterococcus sp. HY326 TaxID=2971265 RepID=UPI0022405652|nr:TcpD family membrane protein [Enterococcus sp. HY326]
MPSLSGFLTWVKTEGGNAIWIVLVVFAVRYLWKQDWGKMVGFMVAAGAAYFVVQNPNVVSSALSKVAELLF